MAKWLINARNKNRFLIGEDRQKHVIYWRLMKSYTTKCISAGVEKSASYEVLEKFVENAKVAMEKTGGNFLFEPATEVIEKTRAIYEGLRVEEKDLKDENGEMVPNLKCVSHMDITDMSRCADCEIEAKEFVKVCEGVFGPLEDEEYARQVAALKMAEAREKAALLSFDGIQLQEDPATQMAFDGIQLQEDPARPRWSSYAEDVEPAPAAPVEAPAAPVEPVWSAKRTTELFNNSEYPTPAESRNVKTRAKAAAKPVSNSPNKGNFGKENDVPTSCTERALHFNKFVTACAHDKIKLGKTRLCKPEISLPDQKDLPVAPNGSVMQHARILNDWRCGLISSSLIAANEMRANRPPNEKNFGDLPLEDIEKCKKGGCRCIEYEHLALWSYFDCKKNGACKEQGFCENHQTDGLKDLIKNFDEAACKKGTCKHVKAHIKKASSEKPQQQMLYEGICWGIYAGDCYNMYRPGVCSLPTCKGRYHIDPTQVCTSPDEYGRCTHTHTHDGSKELKELPFTKEMSVREFQEAWDDYEDHKGEYKCLYQIRACDFGENCFRRFGGVGEKTNDDGTVNSNHLFKPCTRLHGVIKPRTVYKKESYGMTETMCINSISTKKESKKDPKKESKKKAVEEKATTNQFEHIRNDDSDEEETKEAESDHSADEEETKEADDAETKDSFNA